MRIVFLVEGDSDKRAIPPFIKRFLENRGLGHVGCEAVESGGWAKLSASAHERARLYLDRDASYRVVTLLDLHGPDFLPHDKPVGERISHGRQLLESKLRDPRYRCFFAVHELEAWLLSDPSILPRAIQQQIRHHPEEQNDNVPPKKLLKSLYRRHLNREYKETTDAVNLFLRLDPMKAASSCPNLKLLLDQVEQWALAAPPPH